MASIWLGSGLVEEKFVKTFLLPALEGNSSFLDRVIIYPGIQREPGAELLHFRTGPGEKVALIHLSDEKLRHRRGIYKAFRVVLRHYFDPRLSLKRNVYHIPLGWTSAFNGQIRNEEPPSYLWSFCGAVKSDREEMLVQLEDIGASFTHFSSGWGSDDQLPPEEVRQVYADSNFVLCPQGNAHIDSFRVMETLQAGSVPMTVKFLGRDFFRYTFGNHPFVVADDWQHAARIMKHFDGHPDEAILLRARTRLWYQDYLTRLSQDLALIAQGAPLRQLRGEMFRIQKLAIFDLPLLARISLRFARFRK